MDVRAADDAQSLRDGSPAEPGQERVVFGHVPCNNSQPRAPIGEEAEDLRQRVNACGRVTEQAVVVASRVVYRVVRR